MLEKLKKLYEQSTPWKEMAEPYEQDRSYSMKEIERITADRELKRHLPYLFARIEAQEMALRSQVETNVKLGRTMNMSVEEVKQERDRLKYLLQKFFQDVKHIAPRRLKERDSFRRVAAHYETQK